MEKGIAKGCPRHITMPFKLSNNRLALRFVEGLFRLTRILMTRILNLRSLPALFPIVLPVWLDELFSVDEIFPNLRVFARG